MPMTADDIWTEMLAGTDVLKARPNFRYDPVFCANYYPDFFAGRPWLIRVLEKTVMMGKRGGNAYQMLKSCEKFEICRSIGSPNDISSNTSSWA
ncbi:MAG: hypothetical protein AAFY25_12305, partial [Pseudomonadota bacterium]